MEIEGARMCLGGMLVSQSLQYGAKTLFRHSPERHNFCRLTILSFTQLAPDSRSGMSSPEVPPIPPAFHN